MKMRIIAFLALLASAPGAAAFGVGLDAESVPVMAAAGAPPAYGQVWVGQWVQEHGWAGVERQLAAVRDAGATPVIQWYYWGDDISPSCVQHGCAGRSKENWDALAHEMAARAAAVMGERPFLVVLEPEFNKQGISEWEGFDEALAHQASILRAAAPRAVLVVGFGHWGGWEIFDRAVAASDMVGFQILYGSTRNSVEEAVGSAERMVNLSGQLRAMWGKPVLVFDFGIATYGGWEGVQEQAVQQVAARRAELDAAGVQAIVWRYVHDNDHSKGYFGPAESSWGVAHADGARKPAFDDLAALLAPPPIA